MINVWIFGDSFSETHRYQFYLKNLIGIENSNSNEYSILNYAVGSSDMQSIIDRWMKCLPKIKDNDIVIVNLTDASRYRLASFKSETMIPNLVTNSNPDIEEYQFLDKFHSLNVGHHQMIKDGWLDTIPNNRNSIFFEIQKDLPKKEFNYLVELLQYEHQYDCYVEHYVELVKALYDSTTTNKKIVWCWQNQYDTNFILSKNKLKELVFDGKWETIGDISGGDDKHLSPKYDEILANYFYNKLFINNGIQ